MSNELAITVDGLKQFSRDLKQLDRDLPKALRIALNQASDVIVSDARPGVPTRSGRAAGSIKAKSTRTKARVAGGSSRAPYYPWLDFGGSVGRRNSVHRPFLKRGRYLYAAYFRARDAGTFQQQLVKALADVARSAGLEVEEG